jgi:glutamate/tyrosine decarboxylase-like PLP-dependent enzyme
MDSKLLEGVFDIVRTHFDTRGEGKVREWRTVEQVTEALDVAVSDEGMDASSLLQTIDVYLKECVNTQHPLFLQPLWGGLSEAGFAGEVATILANTSIYTWELAPAATIVEQELVRALAAQAGWPQGEGTFTSGGSNANMLAMLLARDRMFPDAMDKGVDGTRLAVFVSAECHYSLQMSAHVLGIGMEGVIKVATDHHGVMCMDALQEAIISSERTPFCVVATAGTTVRGAFDPISKIADLCDEHGLWLHVDAALGAPCLFSPELDHLMAGVERADSLTWDPHKLMGVPLTCSTLLTPHKGALAATCSYVQSAHYLFHVPGEEYDLGRTSLQCGRRVDSLKLWIEWKAVGTDGWRERVERYVALAAQLEWMIESDENLELCSARAFTNVCFRWLEPGLEGDALNEFNEAIRGEMIKRGNVMVSLALVDGKAILRPVICNPSVDENSLVALLDEVRIVALDIRSNRVDNTP